MKQRTSSSPLQSILGGAIGNLVEWYDWYAYSAFALYFAPVFFPKENTTAQLLNTAAIFAVGFLMRPLGGWLLGTIADRRGRKVAMTLSVLLMSLGSLLIAITPSYDTIGLWAPCLLLFARLVQGVSVGGEYGTSATYMSEVATANRRGFYSSFQYVTLIGGQLIALGIQVLLQQFILSKTQLETWGWRIPFIIGALLALVAFYLRRNLAETPSFLHEKMAAEKKGSIRELFTYHPRAVLTVAGLTLGGTLAFYTYSTYMQKFLVNTVHLTKDRSTLITFWLMLIFALMQPVFGHLSDKIGRKPLLIGFGVLGTLCTYPLLTTLSHTTSEVTAFFLLLAALIMVSGYTSISAIIKAELFPAEVRALGVGFPYAITVAIFGGTAEYVALWFKQIGHEPYFYLYITGCIFISLLVYINTKDTKQTSWINREEKK